MSTVTRPSRAVFGASFAVVMLASVVVFVCLAEPQDSSDGPAVPEFPIEGPLAYSVEYLGVTCGYMALESRLEEYEGRPAYHVIMTASNTKFFNKIYRVDGRIDSWVDAETMSTLAYESDITERGRRKLRSYHVDYETDTVTEERRGKVKTFPYEGGSALDPLAYCYRGRVLAGKTGSTFILNLFTDEGVIETGSRVGDLKKFDTVDGKKELLKVQPITADGEMFSRKGEFVYWIEPGVARTVYRMYFDLPFGKLLSKYQGPATESFDRRSEEEKAKPAP